MLCWAAALLACQCRAAVQDGCKASLSFFPKLSRAFVWEDFDALASHLVHTIACTPPRPEILTQPARGMYLGARS